MLVVLMLCGVGTTWGETVTYTFSEHFDRNMTLDGSTIKLDDVVSYTFHKREGGTATQYYTNGTAVRWYGGGTLDIDASNATITKIEITYTQTANSVSANVGTYSLDSSVGTWNGSSSSVKFTQSGTTGQCRISTIKVTYSSANLSETTTTIDATGITNTDVYTSTSAGQLAATVTARNDAISGATVTWSGNNDNVATISSDGTVTLVAPGTVTFTASYAGVDGEYASSSATYEMTVTSSAPYVQPTDLEVSLNNSFFNCTAFSSWNSSYGTSFTGNKDNVSVVYDKADSQNAYIQTSGIRMYAGNTLTFTAPEGYNLVKIEFAGETGFATYLAAEGLSNGTWTGVATEVTISGNSNKKNITNATITLAKVSSVRTPVISLASGSYLEVQNVTISCETDGATIYYTLDGTEPTSASTPYYGAITISETTTLKAIAIKGDDASAVASATYTFPTVYTTIAKFKEANTTAYINLTGAQVVYIDNDKKTIFVKDNSGAIALYNNSGFTTELKAGDILSGIIEGKYSPYKNLPEITNISNIGALTATGNEDVVSVVISPEEIADHLCQVVTLAKTDISKNNEKYYADGNVQLYDSFYKFGELEEGVYKVSGIALVYNEQYEIAPRTADDISAIPVVAAIGNKKYATLQEAFNAAEAGQTVTLLKDYDATAEPMAGGTRQFVINKSITFDGGGYKLTTKQRGIGIGNVNKDLNDKDNINVTIKNVTVLNTTDAARCIDTRGKIGSLTLEGVTLSTNGAPSGYTQPLTIGGSQADAATVTITNSTIQTNDEGTAYYAIITFNPVNMTISNSTIKGWANIYAKGQDSSAGSAGSVFNLDKCTLVSSNAYSGVSNAFGAFMVEDNNVTINVTNSEMTLNNSGDQIQAIALYPYGNTLTGNKVTLGEGNKVSFVEPGKFAFVANRGAAEFTISGGLFNVEVPGELCAEGMTIVSNTDEATKDDYPYAIGEADIYYAWKENGALVGEYLLLATPFDKGYLMDGEFITLQKDITLTENIACQLAEGSFNFTLGEYNVTKGDYSISLLPNVSALTDKQTDIFSAAAANCYIEETKTETGYSYTAVEVLLAAPIIFHDGGEYEGALKVAMAGQGTIKYTLNGGAEQTYTAPINVSETTTITAWTESNGVKSDEVSKTFTIAAATAGPAVEDNYYTIKNNGNNKYVNVAGRKTVTFVDDTATAAGTVIRVKADDKGQVQILRSQSVDIPGYAEKAMNYVPKIVELIVDKLHAEGSGELLGENGLDAIMAKFKESFDYHLYLEEANGGYRIYGRTPSMQPVVDFYAENKANVDAKLPGLEAFINSAIEKVLQKTNGSGASILVPFSLQTVWEKMGSTLTEPVNEASTAKFYEEVLSSETNVWNFAYETAMIYWSKLKAHPKFQDNLDKLGDYAKYIDKVENIRPNFKYYIVQKNDQLDFISQGNSELNAAFTTWTLAERTDFSVAFNEDNLLNGKYYTTLYTDFAYTLPEGVKAYKVTGIEESGCYGYAVTEEVGSQNIAAQTPVLLMSESAETQALTLSESGTAVTDNLLVGPDYLINTYKITAAQVESLFDMAKAFLGEDGYNNYLKEYEHLMLRTAGTVNNKYFYGLSKDDCKNLDENVCLLGNSEEAGIGFANDWQTMNINQAFLVSDIYTAIRLSKVGDVNRDGLITIADVPALVNIILEKVKYPDDAENYDFGAADVNCDGNITITDVTSLVNIILNQ